MIATTPGITEWKVADTRSPSCLWNENEDGWWETRCQHAFEFTDGSPIENSFHFCPFCGLPLTEKKWEEKVWPT